MNPSQRAVIFDMDGTLTRPYLRFDRIREEIGLGSEPVLETIRKMSPEDRARAEAILERHETEAAAASELRDNAQAVLAAIRQAGFPLVLMTRNTRRSVDMVLDLHDLPAFDIIWTRDDGAMKPSPDPIHAICDQLGVASADAWSIGDFHHDIVCGAAAGATTVLLLDKDMDRPTWADEADHVIAELAELLPLLGIHDRIEADSSRTQ